MNRSVKYDLKTQVGQLFMIGISGLSLSDEEKNFIRLNNIGFIILFSRNYSSPSQILELTNEIHHLSVNPPAIFIDQEGGPIVRFGEEGSTVISHMGLAATGRKKNARRAGTIIGKELRELGIDGVFAPVLDVNSLKENPVIGIRSFSDDPEIVSEYAVEFYRGLKKKKILGCGKHYPGHGHTVRDSHLEIPESEIDKKFMSEINLSPFKRLIREKIDSIMTAHVRFPFISNHIATFSPEITANLLRKKLNFKGVLFSDCLEMDAIKDNFSTEEIIQGVIKSSLDVITISHSITLQKELLSLIRSKISNDEIVGERIYESLTRISELKKNFRRKRFRNIRKRPTLRKHLKMEKEMAEESVTILKNDHGLIPIAKNNSVLLIDLRKITHPANFHNKTSENLIKEISGRFFPFSGNFIPENEHRITDEEKKRILKFTNIIIFDHSWSSIMDNTGRSFINSILKIRKDLILVCTNSPYTAGIFPDIKTIILTYGSRNVQMEALFYILSGLSKSKGRLPVTISEEFPIGSGI